MSLVAQEEPADPLGRSNPRGALVRFLQTAHDGNFATAAEYLENPEGQQTDKRELARMLQTVLDRRLNIDLTDVSDEPAGARDDGIGPDLERIGRIDAAKGNVDVVMRRGNSGVWLFSADTLRGIPAIHATLSGAAIERYLPSFLTGDTWFDMALWQWLALSLLAPLAFIAAWVATRVFVRIACGIAGRTASGLDNDIIRILTGPARLCVAVLIFNAGMAPFDLPYLLRWFLRYGELVLFIAAVTWFVLQVVDLGSARVTASLVRHQRVNASKR